MTPKKQRKSIFRNLIEAASNHGAYVPFVVNGKLSAWHYDSGAGLTQCSPRALKSLGPGLEKVGWDEVKFITARDVSTASMTLYRARSFAAMQMDH